MIHACRLFQAKMSGAMTSSFIQAVKNEPCLTYGRLLTAMGDAIPSLMPNDTDVIQVYFITRNI